jgi:redox-sensitive bicupin YhaK (pirin superfamily)
MSAGTGVRHAEFNLEDETTTLFQIWVETDRPGAPPSWGMKPFPKNDRSGKLVTLASGDPDDGALTINADARVMGATLASGGTMTVELQPERHAYLVASKGRVAVNGVSAGPRDGVAITGESRVEITASEDAELVLVDAR